MKTALLSLMLTVLGGAALAAMAIPQSERSHERSSSPTATLGDRHVQAQPLMSSRGRSTDETDHDQKGARGTMSQEVIDRCLEVADEVDPELAQRLRTLCVDDPTEFQRIMRNIGRRFLALAELKSRDPVLYDIKIKELQIESQVDRVSDQLAHALEDGDTQQADELESELRNLIRVQLALSIKAQGDYLRKLQEHVAALEKRIEREAANFDQIVEQRLVEAVTESRAETTRASHRTRSTATPAADILGNLPR